MSEKCADVVQQQRCRECGRFCGLVYRSAGGAGQVERRSCVYCGINPPKCAEETGTVYGCQTIATHVEHVNTNRERYWCEEHAPDDAETLPYVEEDRRNARNLDTDAECGGRR